jgi:hypothetical protein
MGVVVVAPVAAAVHLEEVVGEWLVPDLQEQLKTPALKAVELEEPPRGGTG